MTFSDSLVMVQTYYTGEKEILNKYRYSISPMKDLMAQCVFTPHNIKKLTDHIKPSIAPNYLDEIYAIFSIAGYDYNKSFVLYKDSMLFVDLLPNHIVKEMLRIHLNLDSETYIQTIQSFFKKKIKIVPIATTNFSLLPIGSNTNKHTIWINAGRVTKTKEKRFHSIITFDNGFQLSVDRVELRIQELMKRGFLSHGVIRRDFTFNAVHPTTHLFDFLNVSSTEVTRKILKELLYRDIPDKHGDILARYESNHRLLYRKLIFKELDIEE